MYSGEGWANACFCLLSVTLRSGLLNSCVVYGVCLQVYTCMMGLEIMLCLMIYRTLKILSHILEVENPLAIGSFNQRY